MSFDPREHLDNIKGNSYLPAAARLQWLRSDAPDSEIETELMKLEGEGAMERAIYRARITVIREGQACGKATGWGSETRNDFEDFLEKAETKAISRALAALGYGTPVDPVVDGREQQSGGYQQARSRLNNAPQAQGRPGNGGGNVGDAKSPREGTIHRDQTKAIKNLQVRLGWSEGKLLDFVKQPIESLSGVSAGALITDLNKILTEGGG